MSLLALIAVGLFVLAAATIVGYTLRVGISPMPSSAKAARAMLDLLPEDAAKGAGQEIVELGSGWGGLAIAVAKRYPAANVTAYELSPVPWAWSQLVARWQGCGHIRFLRRDFFAADLREADIVLCYLYPGAMQRLAETPAKLKPRAILITNTFRLPGWQADKLIELDDLYRTHVYRYVVGKATDD